MKYWAGLFWIGVLFAALSGAHAEEGQTHSRELGSSLTTLDGTVVSLGDYSGKVLVINFWATWCAPCPQQMSELKALSDSLDLSGWFLYYLN